VANSVNDENTLLRSIIRWQSGRSTTQQCFR